MKRMTTAIATLLLAYGSVQGALADVAAPDAMVKQVTADVVQALEDNKEQLKSDPSAVYEIVDKLILPHFDFTYMSQLVLARHWRSATAQQREDFTAAFRGLLVKTYSNSLRDFSGEDVEYPAFRAAADADDVTVPMEIIPKAGPSIPLDYSLHKPDGVWKVYDVNIDGLSLVTNYRRTFGSDVKEKGLDALIKQLQSKQPK